MIPYTYSKGTETNHSWAKDEAQFERARKRLEKKGWTVTRIK